MKKLTAAWIRKAESDYRVAKNLAVMRPPAHDEVCFHSQQAAEKFFKALLQEWGTSGTEDSRVGRSPGNVVATRCHGSGCPSWSARAFALRSRLSLSRLSRQSSEGASRPSAGRARSSRSKNPIGATDEMMRVREADGPRP